MGIDISTNILLPDRIGTGFLELMNCLFRSRGGICL